MKKLLFCLLAVLMCCAEKARAQSPPAGAIRVGSTQVQNATDGNCLKVASGKLGQGTCGGATIPPAGPQNCIQITNAANTAFLCNGPTIDGSGNISTGGGLTTGVGSGNAGYHDMVAGTAVAVAANSFGWGAPTTMSTAQRLTAPNAVTVAHSVMILGAPSSNSSTWTYKAIADCTDIGGNHLNFTQSTDGWSCGTSVPANVTLTIASGAKALATGAISSAACTSSQTATATGTASTDAIIATFNADPTSTTGYVPLTSGMLTIIAYPTTDTVNFKVCNNTASSITPGAITLNWRVVR